MLVCELAKSLRLNRKGDVVKGTQSEDPICVGYGPDRQGFHDVIIEEAERGVEHLFVRTPDKELRS